MLGIQLGKQFVIGTKTTLLKCLRPILMVPDYYCSSILSLEGAHAVSQSWQQKPIRHLIPSLGNDFIGKPLGQVQNAFRIFNQRAISRCVIKSGLSRQRIDELVQAHKAQSGNPRGLNELSS